MSTQFEVFVRTLVIGLAVAMPVGAMGALCIERTLARGWAAGVATGLGIATADGVYASVAAFGVTAVSGVLVEWHRPLQLVGGVALVLLGLRTLRSRRDTDGVGVAVQVSTALGPQPQAPRYGGLYASAVGLTLTNPMTIIAFAGVFMSAGLAGSHVARHAELATLGVALGSLAWWIVLVSGTASLRRGMSNRSALWVTRMSGAVVAAFGVITLAAALAG